MRAVVVQSPGGIEQLKVVDNYPKPVLDPSKYPDHLLVRVHAAGLNRTDILQRQGKYPPPPGESEIIGLEIAGEVEAMSDKAAKEGKWKKGDRVMCLLGGGGYAEYAIIPSSLAMAVPSSISYEEAASIPEAFMTAYQALVWLAELHQRPQPKVLIHAGASGVGLAAIQIVKQVKDSKVIVTAGSDDKLEFCRQMGADIAINYKEGPFAPKVLEATNGKGVDILLDFVGAEYWTGNLESLGVDSTMIIQGTMSGVQAPGFNMGRILSNRITIRGSTLRARTLDYKCRLAADVYRYAVEENRLTEGKIKPVISKVFEFNNVQDAHSFMELNKNTGKIILNNI